MADALPQNWGLAPVSTLGAYEMGLLNRTVPESELLVTAEAGRSYAEMRRSDDYRETLACFLKKRPPVYLGR